MAKRRSIVPTAVLPLGLGLLRALPLPVDVSAPTILNTETWLRAFFIILSASGFYGIYWYFVTLEELHKANGREESGCLWTFLLFVPIVSLFSFWHYSQEYSEFVADKYPGIGIFILWIVFSPAVWFLVQSDLNRAASQRR